MVKEGEVGEEKKKNIKMSMKRTENRKERKKKNPDTTAMLNINLFFFF